MSLRERLRLLPRSLYFAVFLAMVGTLSLSFLVFRQISVRLESKHIDPIYDRLDELQLETASRNIEQRRPEGAGELSGRPGPYFRRTSLFTRRKWHRSRSRWKQGRAAASLSIDQMANPDRRSFDRSATIR